MIHVMNDDERKIMIEVEKVTDTDYEFRKTGRISTDYLFEAIQELLHKIEDLEEQIWNIEEDVAENYRPIYQNPYAEVGMSEKDFI